MFSHLFLRPTILLSMERKIMNKKTYLYCKCFGKSTLFLLIPGWLVEFWSLCFHSTEILFIAFMHFISIRRDLVWKGDKLCYHVHEKDDRLKHLIWEIDCILLNGNLTSPIMYGGRTAVFLCFYSVFSPPTNCQDVSQTYHDNLYAKPYDPAAMVLPPLVISMCSYLGEMSPATAAT